VPGRPDDSFGIGLARTQFSSSFLPFLRQQVNLGLQRADAIEMYYNMAITPWMNPTSDLRIVDSGLNKAISQTTGNSPASTPSPWPELASAFGSNRADTIV